MYKGNYVLLPINELRERIKSILKIDFTLCNLSVLTLIIEKSDMSLDTTKTLSKVVGENSDISKNIDKSAKNVRFNMRECSPLLSKALEIKTTVIFDDETILVNDDKDVYLFYREI